ncbi:homeodomain-like protein [Tanacetum coccineum]|uniref:Homeodomain-like protein n=1 Tax=Tanacetum coccineum TaxID=301880 RepID=A0ABQ5H5J0_9ASTR
MNSPEFNLISDLEDQFEEEETEAIAETMEEYMCKTRGDYGSGVTRPKINAKDHFELKGQFLKELHDNTFSGSDHEDANEHIEKVLEIVDLFHIPNITQDQIMLRAFPMSSPEPWDVSYVKDPITRKTVHLKKKEKPLKKHIILNLVYHSYKEVTIEQQLRDSTKGIICCYQKPRSFDQGFGNLNQANEQDRTMKHPKGIAKNVLVGIGKFVFPVDFIILDMPEDINVPLILGRPFLSTAHAKIDVFKRKITLRRRNQVNDLEPTIEEGEVVDKPMFDEVKTRNDGNMISRINGYPSYCDFDRRIHIDCAYNLKFSCMMGFKYVHTNFLLILPINVMSKKFYNSIMIDKIEFNGRNELGNFVNAPIFIENFHVIIDFRVVEDMDPYLDEGM